MPSSTNRFSAIIIVGFTAVVITCLLFFTAVSEPDGTQLTAFFCLLCTEILTIAISAGLERRRDHAAGLLFRSGAYGALTAYAGASALLALLFISKLAESLKWLISLEFIFLALLLAVLAMLWASSKSNAEENAAIQARFEPLRRLEDRLDILRQIHAKEPWALELDKIKGEIHFFDHNCSVPADGLLDERLSKVEKLANQAERPGLELADEIKPLLEDLRSLIKLRTQEAGRLKRGGF